MDLSSAKNWTDAVCLIVDDLLQNNKCFSSGEVTDILRQNRKDLYVTVPQVGQFLRQLDSSGALMYPSGQLSERAGRNTSNNVFVYVYGPTYVDAMNHDFERNPNQQTKTVQKTQPTVKAPTNSQPTTGLYATVQGDGRITIPKRAFEELSKKTGLKLKPGNKVYVSLDHHFNTIIVDPTKSSGKEYTITKDLGKIKYMPENSMLPSTWKRGTKYEILVSYNTLVVDLKKVV